MSLPIQVVAGSVTVLASKEVIEAQFPSMRSRGVRGDVAPDAVEILVRSCNHHHGVPSNDAVKAFLQGQVPGKGSLICRMNRVEVCGVDHVDVDTSIVGRRHGSEEKSPSLFGAKMVFDSPD